MNNNLTPEELSVLASILAHVRNRPIDEIIDRFTDRALGNALSGIDKLRNAIVRQLAEESNEIAPASAGDVGE